MSLQLLRRIFGRAHLVLATCLLATSPVAPAGSDAGHKVYDDRGNLLHASPQYTARRIVALAPHLCEMVYTAGAGDKLIATSEHCDYPPEAGRLPTVADYRSINYELLAQLKPDLILVWTAVLNAQRLAKLRLITPRVFVSEPHTFRAIADNLIAIGALTGHRAQAQNKADLFLRNINTLRAQYQNKYKDSKQLDAVYLIHASPPMTVNGGHWISRLLNVCGIRNPFAEVTAQVVKINSEALLSNPPDILIHSMDEQPVLKLLPGLPAFHISSDIVQRPTTRLYAGAQRLCEIVDNFKSTN